MTEIYSSGGVRISYLNRKVSKQLPVQPDAGKPFLLLMYAAGPRLLLKPEAGEPVLVFEGANRLQLLFLPPGAGMPELQRKEEVELFAIQCSEALLLEMLKADKELTANIRKCRNKTVAGLLLQEPLIADSAIKLSLYSLLEQDKYAPAVYELLAQAALFSTWAWFVQLRANPVEEAEMSGKELVIAEKAKAFLDALPERVEYTIITLAKELGTNETTLKAAFKKLTGTTIHKYYHAKRMEKAEGFLKAGKSITETSKLIGYKHVSHFSHIYKQQYGVLPGKIYG